MVCLNEDLFPAKYTKVDYFNDVVCIYVLKCLPVMVLQNAWAVSQSWYAM